MTTDQSQLLGQAQLYQQQLQAVAMQKENMNMQSLEINNALEELEKRKTGDVYKISGPLLIKGEREEIKKDLKEKKELIDIKVKTLEKSEEKLKGKMDDLREQLTGAATGG